MRHPLIVLTLVALALVSTLTACAGEGSEVGALPTIMELPTETETSTPTETELPTETATETDLPTETPTSTATETSTPDATGTADAVTAIAQTTLDAAAELELQQTETAIAVLNAGIQLTQAILETANAAASANPPETGTATLAPGAPRINLFEASQTTAAPGMAVTLRWDTVADVVRIERLNINGQVIQTFSVTPVGELPVTIPANEGNTVTYRLTGIRGVQEVSSLLSITVSGDPVPVTTPGTSGTPATGVTNCSINWFFGNEFVPTEYGCPTVAATQVAGAFQPFERGLMIYLAYPPATIGNIYVLANDPTQPNRGSVTQYANSWDNTSTFASYGCAAAPPPGRYEPQQMFAWAYCTQLAPGGFWSTILGYGTNLIDTSQRQIQFDASGALYVDVSDVLTGTNAVYRIVPVQQGMLSSEWTRIK